MERKRLAGRAVGRGSQSGGWVSSPRAMVRGWGRADSQCLPLSSLKAQVTRAPGGGGLATLSALVPLSRVATPTPLLPAGQGHVPSPPSCPFYRLSPSPWRAGGVGDM